MAVPHKIDYFSNPDIYFEGNPLGMPGDNGNDNSRTLDNTMALVDSFGEELNPDLSACSQPSQFYFDPHAVNSGEELDISIPVCNYGERSGSRVQCRFLCL